MVASVARRAARAVAAVLVVSPLAVGWAAGPAYAAPTLSYAVRCGPVHIESTVGSTPATLRGTMCRPATGTPRAVQLALAGATFDQAYWLLPARPGQPSYAQYMAAAGYAVLALDRPGSGLSDRPPADATTLDTEAAAIHQVIGALRAGTVDGRAYPTVIGVGHSFGSSVLIAETTRHNDLDALAATGFVHSVGPLLDRLNAAIVPAADDRLLRLTHPPAGYLTTAAGSRRDLFFTAGAAPSALVADELLKSTMTSGEQATLAAGGDPALSQAIRVPVFLGVGQRDDLFCNGAYLTCSDSVAVAAWEGWFYSPDARLATYVLPGAGHALNWHSNAPDLFAAMLDWADRQVA